MNEKETRPKRGIFSRESLDQIQSPDQLNDYVRVATPRTWVIAAALLLVAAALTVWALVGRIPQYTEARGIGIMDLYVDPDGQKEAGEDDPNRIENAVRTVMCFVDSNLVNPHQLDGKDANVFFDDGFKIQGKTVMTEATPYSVDELEQLLDYNTVFTPWTRTRLKLENSEYWYVVNVQLEMGLDDLYSGETADVLIVTSEATPGNYLFQ